MTVRAGLPPAGSQGLRALLKFGDEAADTDVAAVRGGRVASPLRARPGAGAFAEVDRLLEQVGGVARACRFDGPPPEIVRRPGEVGKNARMGVEKGRVGKARKPAVRLPKSVPPGAEGVTPAKPPAGGKKEAVKVKVKFDRVKGRERDEAEKKARAAAKSPTAKPPPPPPLSDGKPSPPDAKARGKAEGKDRGKAKQDKEKRESREDERGEKLVKSKSSKERREARDAKSSKERRESKESKDSKDSKESRESKERKPRKEPRPKAPVMSFRSAPPAVPLSAKAVRPPAAASPEKKVGKISIPLSKAQRPSVPKLPSAKPAPDTTEDAKPSDRDRSRDRGSRDRDRSRGSDAKTPADAAPASAEKERDSCKSTPTKPIRKSSIPRIPKDGKPRKVDAPDTTPPSQPTSVRASPGSSSKASRPQSSQNRALDPARDPDPNEASARKDRPRSGRESVEKRDGDRRVRDWDREKDRDRRDRDEGDRERDNRDNRDRDRERERENGRERDRDWDREYDPRDRDRKSFRRRDRGDRDYERERDYRARRESREWERGDRKRDSAYSGAPSGPRGPGYDRPGDRKSAEPSPRPNGMPAIRSGTAASGPALSSRQPSPNGESTPDGRKRGREEVGTPLNGGGGSAAASPGAAGSGIQSQPCESQTQPYGSQTQGSPSAAKRPRTAPFEPRSGIVNTRTIGENRKHFQMVFVEGKKLGDKLRKKMDAGDKTVVDLFVETAKATVSACFNLAAAHEMQWRLTRRSRHSATNRELQSAWKLAHDYYAYLSENFASRRVKDMVDMKRPEDHHYFLRAQAKARLRSSGLMRLRDIETKAADEKLRRFLADAKAKRRAAAAAAAAGADTDSRHKPVEVPQDLFDALIASSEADLRRTELFEAAVNTGPLSEWVGHELSIPPHPLPEMDKDASN